MEGRLPSGLRFALACFCLLMLCLVWKGLLAFHFLTGTCCNFFSWDVSKIKSVSTDCIFLSFCSIVFLPFNSSFVPYKTTPAVGHHGNNNEYWQFVFSRPPSWKILGVPFVRATAEFCLQETRSPRSCLSSRLQADERWVWNTKQTTVWVCSYEFYMKVFMLIQRCQSFTVLLTHQKILTRSRFNR